MSDIERKIEEAVDRFYETRREQNSGTPGGRQAIESAGKQLVRDVQHIYPYDEWLKRHD